MSASVLAPCGGYGRVIGFPEVEAKDRVDAMSMALQRLRNYVEPYRVIVPPREIDWERMPF